MRRLSGLVRISLLSTSIRSRSVVLTVAFLATVLLAVSYADPAGASRGSLQSAANFVLALIKQAPTEEASPKINNTDAKTQNDSADKQVADSNGLTPGPITQTPEPIKYCTTPDPYCASYSLTPPKPNPASVDIRITHPGQVAIGTLISYNPTKGESKTFYGGDLIFSPSVLTYSLSQPAQQLFTVSTPGGAIADRMPYGPWYDPGKEFFAAFDSTAYTGPGSSWNMMVDAGYPVPIIGAYQVHVVATHEESATVSFQYDGFITVNVIP